MKPATMCRISLGIWAATAAGVLLREVMPQQIQPVLKLGIPAAVTSSILAGIAAIVAAQERHTDNVTASNNEHVEMLSALVVQVTEISKNDHDRLAYLRGMVAERTEAGHPNGAAAHPAHQ